MRGEQCNCSLRCGVNEQKTLYQADSRGWEPLGLPVVFAAEDDKMLQGYGGFPTWWD